MNALIKIILAAALLASVGCAKEKKGGGGIGTVPPTDGRTGTTPPPPTGGGASEYYYDSGSTSPLEIEGSSAGAKRARLGELFFQSPPNNPSNTQINVDLRNMGNGTWGGEVSIFFTDGGVPREATFSTKHPYTYNVEQTQYNVWFTSPSDNTKVVFHGFFQDEYGAIVLVIDGTQGMGDGLPVEHLSGSVYFQNFNRDWPNNPYQGPLRNCWTIEVGPYDCRTFLVGDTVISSSSVHPNNAGSNRPLYKKLGTFTGLSRSKAFNQ